MALVGIPAMELLHQDWEIMEGELHDLEDTADFLNLLSRLTSSEETNDHGMKAVQEMFDKDKDLFISRAPGRLDVMGGIADYSGSLVLQMPIKEACHVAIQRAPKNSEAMLKVVSLGADRSAAFEMRLADFVDAESREPITYEQAHAYFKLKEPSLQWASYVAGTFLVLMREKGVNFLDHDVRMFVSSDVPEGKGVSSSAAVEVSSMSAVSAVFGVHLEPTELATLCQMVENRVAGAPCGIMDQMASALGRESQLLSLLCRPSEVQGHVSLPPGVSLWGLDSGVRHSVQGSDYSSVRAGAFIGRTLIQVVSAGWLFDIGEGSGDLEEDQLLAERQLEHLSELRPHRFERRYSQVLPEELEGSLFLAQCGSHGDPLTRIDPDKTYAVLAPTQHPVLENFRVESFQEILAGRSGGPGGQAPAGEGWLRSLGELMLQSHYSYSRCGLGSDGTDRIVRMAMQIASRSQNDPQGGTLYGAKITGGGSGGTVCVLGRTGPRSDSAIQEIVERYWNETGHRPFVFRGSSPGACQFGYLRVRRRAE